MRIGRVWLVFTLVLLASALPAQRLLTYFYGQGANSYLGPNLAMGDVNGDGFADVLARHGRPPTLQLVVFSGKDNSTLMSIPYSRYISQVAIGDINRDGFADIVIGDPNAPSGNLNDAGNLRVVSGKDGKDLHSIFGDTTDRYLGHSVAFAGDVDRDGFPDLVVGSPGGKTTPTSRVEVYSGNDAKVLHTFAQQAPWRVSAVAGIGDIDLDGHGDLAVTTFANGITNVHLLSGKEGKLLRTLPGSLNQSLGNQVYPAGDIDRDGHPDIVASAPGASRVFVFSGKDGTVLYTFTSQSALDRFGLGLAVADLDQDSYQDIIVGASQDGGNGHDAGAVWVFSGKDGKVMYGIRGLWPVPSNQAGGFGIFLAAGPDVNGDGAADFAIGDGGNSINGAQAGAVWVFSGIPHTKGYSNFGKGCSSQVLHPTLSAVQPPRLGHDVILAVRNLPPNQIGQFVIGFSDRSWNSTRLPLDLSPLGAPGCQLLVAPFLQFPIWTASGVWTFRVKVPADFGLLSATFYNQCWAADQNANAAGIAVSDGGKGVVGS